MIMIMALELIMIMITGHCVIDYDYNCNWPQSWLALPKTIFIYPY